ncbi:hypothetical protein D3C87_144660 [compost metagenome]
MALCSMSMSCGKGIGVGPNQMGNNLPVVNLGTGIKAKKIAVGFNHNCAILTDGRLKCWGENSFAFPCWHQPFIPIEV